MKEYSIKTNRHSIEVSGSKGIFTYDIKVDGSFRTKNHRRFISAVLRTYGTKAVEDIMWYEDRM